MASFRIRPSHVLVGLVLLSVVAIVAFMTWDAKGPWSFVLGLRGRKLWGLVLCAHAIGVSTVLFQTVSGNRILTPAIMGFDALFQLVQTTLVFFLGGFAYLTLPPELRFIVNASAMILLSTLLFRWLFSRDSRNLHLLVLVGIVFGVLFRSLSGLMQRMINPNDFVVLQDAMFASFNAIEPTLLIIATIVLAVTSLALFPLLGRLDVLLLGREPAIGLGVDHVRTVSLVLALVAVMVSVSTALVGPVLFFGLLVANLAYIIMPTHRHVFVLPTAVLLGVVGLVGGQAVLEHALLRHRPFHHCRVRRRHRLSHAHSQGAFAMIEIRGVSKSYGATRVVDDVTATLPRSGITSIIGPNGAGKSTLLGMVSRLLSMDSGTVTVDGLDVSRAPSEALARRLAILRQDNHIAARLTVRDLVAFGRFPHSKGRPTSEDKRHIDEALAFLDLTDLGSRFLDELSGGQRQRAFVAMVLCQDTDYVLLDEPLNNLDVRHAVGMMKQLRRAARELGKTIVLVLHDINFASVYSDYIVAMKAGRVVHEGPPDRIMTSEVLGGIYDLPVHVETVAGRRIGIYYE